MSRESRLLGLSADRVLGPNGLLGPSLVWLEPSSGTVVALEGAQGRERSSLVALETGSRLVDLAGCTVVPGFVDVHVHGAAGVSVNGSDPSEVERSVVELASFSAAHGVTGLLATTVSDTPARLAATVEGVGRTVGRPTGGARVLGTHLEGPFISPTRSGAQDVRAVRPPDEGELGRLLDLGAGTVRLVTLAPELPGSEALVARALAAGALVALGHSEADYDTARRAFDAGATHVTHLFNAMEPLHHRRPGLVTAALLEPSVTLELVCDLRHVHPALVALVARLALDRTVLVSDSTAAGLPEGEHLVGQMRVRVGPSGASLAADDSVIAGSTLTMERAVGNFAASASLHLEEALRAASTVPATLLDRSGLVAPGAPPPSGAGVLRPGAPADLVVLGEDLEVVATVVGGEVVHDPAGALA